MATDLTIPYATAKRLATSANCRDPQWLYSFLVHCDSEEDARHTIDALRRNCADRFKQICSRVTHHAVERPPARRESGQRAGRGRKYE